MTKVVELKTYEDRLNYMRGLSCRVIDGDITVKEWLTLCYHWTAYERALRRRDRIRERIAKHAKHVNDTFNILDFRSQLNQQ